MKIILVSLLASLVGCHPSSDEGLRSSITKIVGKTWSDRLLGESTQKEPAIELPEIPSQTKNTTDIGTYSKPEKRATEYDQLSEERIREFDLKFLKELFLVTRKSEAHDEDLVKWLNTLDQGGSREGVYQALVLDEVYAALENMEESTNPQTREFMVKVSQKFLHQTFKDGVLDRLNHYSLKRILVEKVLDLMEYYETRNLDSLYRWYAVLSADLARDYGEFLKNGVRSNTSAAYHYTWAKEMPIQHIKSETIVKIHSVINSLQP